MNTISQFTPNQVKNITPVNSTPKNNVNFTGALGDKFVREVLSGADIDPKTILREAQGTFGLKAGKVEDILESFIGEVKNLLSQKGDLANRLTTAQKQIHNFPQEKLDAVSEAEVRLSAAFRQKLAEKNNIIAEKDGEIAGLKTQFEKYEPLVKVKSVEELDTIMPDRVVEILDDMVAHKTSANKSMADFLFNGAGQEEALAQIERNNQIMRAHEDGMLEIDALAKKLDVVRKEEGIYPTSDSSYTLNMIENALVAHPNGSYLSSPVIKAQVKNNAMAVLSPMADNRYCNTNQDALASRLDEVFKRVEDFHRGFAKGLEKYRKRYPNAQIEVNRVDFDTDKSKIIITFDEAHIPSEISFWQVSNHGNSNWA